MQPADVLVCHASRHVELIAQEVEGGAVGDQAWSKGFGGNEDMLLRIVGAIDLAQTAGAEEFGNFEAAGETTPGLEHVGWEGLRREGPTGVTEVGALGGVLPEKFAELAGDFGVSGFEVVEKCLLLGGGQFHGVKE
jgi:hypothetical protein